MNQFERIGTFCEKCRNVTCTCKDYLQVEYEYEDEDEKDYSSFGLCRYCNHYHDLDNECTEEFEY